MTRCLRLIALLGCTASVSGCDYYFSDLRFVNGTNSRVVGLTVSDGSNTWNLGDLGRGERVNFSGHLSGEGGPTVTWEWQGQRFKGEGCYYISGSPAKGTITVMGTKLRYRCG